MPAPFRRPLSPLSQRIADLQKIEELIRDFRTRLGDIAPAYRTDVAAELKAIADDLAAPVPRVPIVTRPMPSEESAKLVEESADDDDEVDEADRPRQGNVADQMIRFFVNQNNRPATIGAVVQGAGLNQQTVHSILYKRNRGRFVQVTGPGGPGVGSQWKLSDETLTSVQATQPGGWPVATDDHDPFKD